MTYSVRNIAISVVMAIAAAVAVLVYTTSYKQSVTHGQAHVRVLVASRDIPAGTRVEDAQGSLQSREVLVGDRAPGSLDSTAGLTGKVAAQTVYAGQQVVASVFAAPATQAPSLQLTRTERAIRIACDSTSCIVGQIKAGDKVDVYGTFKVKDPKDGGTGTSALVTRLLLANVKVLEVPQLATKKGGSLQQSGGPGDKQQVMLEVDQRTAAKLAYMEGTGDQAGGQLWLAARPADATAQEQAAQAQTLDSLLLDDLPAAEAAKLLARYGQNGQIGG